MNIPFESSYQSTRLDIDVQQTLNLFPHSRGGYRQYPGLVEYASFLSSTEALNDTTSDPIVASDGPVFVSVSPGGNDRGLLANGPNGAVYQVTGPALYSIDAFGNGTYIGEISNDPMPVVMATDGTRLVITTGDTAYQYTVAGGLVAITDADLDTAYTCAYLDSRFAFDQPSGQFAVSAIDDPTDISALDFAEAEYYDDTVLRVYSLNQLLYLFGQRSTEMWYTSGTGRPPLDRQAVREFGIAGRYACDSIDDRLYFIDHNRRPAFYMGQQYQTIFVPAIGEEWASYGSTVVSNARVQAYSLHQENFVDFIFQEVSKVWTYHETSGSWFEKTFKTTSLVDAYNVVLGSGYSDKKLHKLDFSDYQIDGASMTRRKDLPPVSSELFGDPGKDMTLNSLNVAVKVSGTTDITVSVSKDLSSFTTIGTKTATGNQVLRFFGFGKGREFILRIETSDNTLADFIAVGAEAEVLNG